MHPLLSGRVYWIRRRLNLDKVEKELSKLVGIHNFSSLTKKASLQFKSSPVREVKEARLEKVQGTKGLYKITIRANSFLHNMIRIIVGTIFDLSLDKLDISNILDIISETDRRIAGKTLPSSGLYFVRAYYKDYPQIDELYSRIYD